MSELTAKYAKITKKYAGFTHLICLLHVLKRVLRLAPELKKSQKMQD